MMMVKKGHYLGLGTPSLPNPNVSSTALVASAGTSVRVAVQCVKFKDNHKTVNVGPKLAIPHTFDGYFEILNEDGRAVRCIESVQVFTAIFSKKISNFYSFFFFEFKFILFEFFLNF